LVCCLDACSIDQCQERTRRLSTRHFSAVSFKRLI
jgi:hypothetical protein